MFISPDLSDFQIGAHSRLLSSNTQCFLGTGEGHEEAIKAMGILFQMSEGLSLTSNKHFELRKMQMIAQAVFPSALGLRNFGASGGLSGMIFSMDSSGTQPRVLEAKAT